MNEVTFKEGTLSPLKEKKKRKLRGSKLGNFIFYVAVLALSIAVSFCAGYAAEVLYCNNSYVHFYVNGMSMYPTLNASAEAKTWSGSDMKPNTPKYRYGNFDSPGIYRCDAGLADASAGYMDKIERFSIVSSYYESDYEKDSSGNYILDENGKPIVISGKGEKIKRVIGLPGESLYFDASGELYVKMVGAEDYEKVEQPFLEEQSWWTDEMREWRINDNPYVASAKSNKTWTLTDDQYFICGDNRAHSTDSRAEGPVYSHSITGLAVAVNGKVNYEITNDRQASASSNIFDLYMPWNYRYL